MPQDDWRHDVPLSSASRLEAAGWERAPEAPVWSFLPAVWPTAARAWLPDDDDHEVTVYDRTGTRVVPMDEADRAEVEHDLDLTAAAAGFPDRPHGRIWYLGPVRDTPASEWCARAMHELEARPDGRFCASPELAALVRELLGGPAPGSA